jgi:hypothetical protein
LTFPALFYHHSLMQPPVHAFKRKCVRFVARNSSAL